MVVNVISRAGQFLESLPHSLRAHRAIPYSQLYILSDEAGWILDEEAREMLGVAGRLGFKAYRTRSLFFDAPQAVHYTSQFMMARPNAFNGKGRFSIDYFHGMPHQDADFERCYKGFLSIHSRLTRVRVSHSQIEDLILESGVPRDKVHRIPIGINLSYFRPASPDEKREKRKELGLPDQAVVIGSFQKDGQGWGEGLEPKAIKGPDIFVRTLGFLKQRIPELWVLLTGPSRGYVKKGLTELGIPFVHHYLKDPSKIGEYYRALDLYIVASRDEGGPKAILESMGSGIPLVTTRVGQARDIVIHGQNAWMVESEDVEGLAHCAETALSDSAARRQVLDNALKTAPLHTYEAQTTLWRNFFKGYVKF